jgi:thioredoxin-dependent peroxiredoxin
MKLVVLLLVAGVVVVVALAIRPRRAAAAMLKEGQIAPPFATQMVVGEQVSPISLADFHGKRVILYFYPKDGTPGCTKEACSFRDGYAKFQQAGLVVLGCSIDSADAHKAFIQKYGLPFPLLLDPDKKIATEYGAANGIPILGFDRRITYVIGEDGRILKVYPNVDPSAHSAQILSDIGSLPPPAAAAPEAAAPASPPSASN